MLFGLMVVSVVTAVVGYFVTKWLWRERMGRKWRTRLLRRNRARELDLALGRRRFLNEARPIRRRGATLVPPPERRGLPAFLIILGAAAEPARSS